MSRRAARSAPAAFAFALPALLGLAALAAAAAGPAGCARDVPCQLNSDCVIGYCLNGTCQKMCADATRDCPPGYLCDANAQCVPPETTSGTTATGTGGGTTSGGLGGAGTTSSTTVTTGTGASGSTTVSSSSSSTTSSTSGGGSKHELDLCASDAQCAAPLVCRTLIPGGPKRCTRTCSSTGECMAGTICQAIGSDQYCAGDDTGRPCGAAAVCNFACLDNQYCTSQCISGADCPNGYGCMQVGNYTVCVKAEVPCDTSDASGCIAPAACDVDLPLVVGGCTLVCTTAADCPQRAALLSPWTCDSGGICRRPPDVFGPLQGGATPAQYACNAQGTEVNVCNDAQHIDFGAFDIPSPPAVSCSAQTTTAGIPTDSCVDSCRYQGGCAFGFACVAVGNIGNGRIGLCLPTGGGEVGTPCQQDSECAFGYCRGGTTCSRDCTADGVCPSGSTCVAGGGPPVESQPFRRCQ